MSDFAQDHILGLRPIMQALHAILSEDDGLPKKTNKKHFTNDKNDHTHCAQ